MNYKERQKIIADSPISFKYLKRFNIAAGILHLVQGITMLALGLLLDWSRDIYTFYLDIDIMRARIGGQMIDGEEVTQRVNALSFAIQKEIIVRELAKADTCYAPPLNETWEPMILAAEIAIRKLR